MKIVCICSNYGKNIRELEYKKIKTPVFFLKPDSAILPKKMPFFIPPFSKNIHCEIEILVKINKVGKHIDSKFANKYYDEIGLGIDFTAIDMYKKCKSKGLPWEKAKAFDGSAVIGDFFKKKEFKNLQNLQFELYKNEKLIQYGNTKHMFFGIDEIISYVSQYLTLKKGDIIFTGSPSESEGVVKNDLILGFLDGKKYFEIKVK